MSILMTEKLRLCPDCNCQMFQRWNSVIWYCPTCQISNNRVKARQCNTKGEKVSKIALKGQKGNIDKRLDEAWSLLVKLKAGMKCEYCGKRYSLNSHHIYSRGKKSVRWDTLDGICLCVGHHIGMNFSAHKTPAPFIMWLIKYKGEKFMEDLQWKSNQTNKLSPFEKQFILDELKEQVEKYSSDV
jgi:hypothetical protein